MNRPEFNSIKKLVRKHADKFLVEESLNMVTCTCIHKGTEKLVSVYMISDKIDTARSRFSRFLKKVEMLNRKMENDGTDKS